MPITIYWGPPGSYKTSSALIDFFANAAFKGRTIYTNIRGLDDRDRAVAVLERVFPRGKNGAKKIPESWQLIYATSEDSKGKQAWQTFFHTAPLGALIIIDEAQQIWRKEMRPKDLEAFDYPGGADRAEQEKRPPDIRTAFELHRHFNWDFVFTCQNLLQLHEMIRQTAEMAHKHQNLASVLTFMKGHYVVKTHPADSNVNSKTVLNQRNRKIQTWVFDLYKSTATDEVSDTNVGTSVWRNPAFVFPIAGIVVISLYLLIFASNPFTRGRDKIEENAAVSLETGKNPPGNGLEGGSLPTGKGGQGLDGAVDRLRFLEVDSLKSKLWIVGDSFARGVLFEVSGEEESSGIILDQLVVQKLGYEIEKYDPCLVKVSKEEEQQYVRCRGTIGKKKEKGVL